MRTGTVNLPLHGGKAPRWLFNHMKDLSGQILSFIVSEYGPDEVLDRLEGTYTRNSGVFKTVAIAMNKLNRAELSALHAVLLCEIPKKSEVTFNVRRNSYFGEYEVEVFENGVKNPARSYFTDGREDAYETMKAMREEEEKK